MRTKKQAPPPAVEGRERSLIAKEGGLMAKVCPIARASLQHPDLEPELKAQVDRYILPGLDAHLCRCPQCLQMYPEGVYWVDGRTRDRAVRKITVFRAVDEAAESHGV